MPQTYPIISLIAAMANNRVIGINNRLPWHLPADLRHFKKLTVGKPIIMGRRTWESLPGMLPDRPHIVVSRDSGFQAAGCKVVHSVDEALAAAGDAPEVMIVGGAALYAEMLPRADRMYLTMVQEEPEGDAFFPAYDQAEWNVLNREEHPSDEKNRSSYCFLSLARCQKKVNTERR